MNARTLLIVLIAVAVLGYGGYQVASGFRGIRNNNPGNIRLSGTRWAGQVPIEAQTDPEFVQFLAPEYGIRAMAKILGSYASRGVDTIAEIIATWAPPSENDTAAYVTSVAQRTGIPVDHRITVAQWPALIAAIIQHENGEQPYTAQQIAQGIALA